MNQQLQHMGWPDFNSLWGHNPNNPQEGEFVTLLNAFQCARLYGDKAVSPGKRSDAVFLYRDLEQHLKQGLSQGFQVSVRDVNHAFHLIRQNWLNLPSFKAAMIYSLVGELVQLNIDTVCRGYFVYAGGELVGLQNLWSEFSRRWPNLRAMKVHPHLVPHFITEWSQKAENLIVQFT